MVVSTVMGVLTAQAFRQPFRGSGVVFYSVILGMIVPGVLLGLGMVLLANQVGIDRNATIDGHHHPMHARLALRAQGSLDDLGHD